jgi:aspartyl-tRNA(Asn)/glutamyl-tRNA(Gln) amidotransferase subunit A
LLAAPFEEEKLLRVARSYEQATTWHLQRPPEIAAAGAS